MDESSSKVYEFDEDRGFRIKIRIRIRIREAHVVGAWVGDAESATGEVSLTSGTGGAGVGSSIAGVPLDRPVLP